MYTDPTGHFPWLVFAALMLFTPVGGTALQVAASVLGYAGFAVASVFDEDIRKDMDRIGWNPFNSDETADANELLHDLMEDRVNLEDSITDLNVNIFQKVRQ